MSQRNRHLQIVLLFAAAALLTDNRGTADDVKSIATPGRSSLIASLFDDRIVASNVTVVRNHADKLPEAEH